ncbi:MULTISPECIES: outer membrane lipoprotein chaperone LolA [Pseudomonadaceae]|uniref:Outer-membrane lipoprotein carrier protein n=1 Tax=Metapseudomonas otitidis TaxID=319939 RepID=A0A7X3KVY2_9GAMM|nr:MULTISPECIES: outer membrane lipoprotein chaperone LolA [Pseudomonas]MDH0337189.1 outer membrane lipoprotein chaperone LolA [Pseudomonas otitidis]MDU9395449.1 outer membrane lipoprotein chaperone LolA [Pseudomonas sp. zfem003]MDV3439717.1 outer membrane lipoprotein chaperone LolA [Pseudomonas otitidis]MEE1896079.1 outer membrane lipoprotein chaperone LolA [Pseudomonas otitidis]MWK58234.1 outer membrane lipoprotein chaperone LolA [Pseudomonas otitidis]
MRLIRMLLVAALGFVASQVQADDQVAISRLTEMLNKAQTITGRFSQLTLDGSGTQLQETSGELALKRPGLFRWHTDEPMEQLLVSNGEKVWLYDPDLQQVTIQTLDQRLTHTPALLLSGDVSKISENFEITHKEGGDVVDFILKPKAKDTLFDTLRLSFRSGVINDMQLIDSVGQRTNILFLGVKMNQKLDAAQFDFKIPEGADVIQE